MKNLINKVFGANWKTAVSGIGSALFASLTVLAALPYDLGGVALLIPPEWKAKVVVAGTVAAFVLRVWNSISQKDKNVTGGVVQQTADGSMAAPASQDSSSSVEETTNAKPMK